MKPLTLQEQSMKAWKAYKRGNISYWTIPDDDPEAKLWREVWKKGFTAAGDSQWNAGIEEAIKRIIRADAMYPEDELKIVEELKRLKR